MKPPLPKITGRPWIAGGAAVAVLVVAGVGIYWLTRDGGTATASTSYRLVAASTGTIRESISSTGTIEPATQDSLNFAVSGEVTSVRVTAGQRVAKGAVLATVDSASLKSSLAQAKASLASSQSRLTTDTDASASDTQLAADTAAVTAAQGQVDAAETALGEATLTSPIAGVVATVNLTVGQQVSGSSGSGSSGSGSSGSGSSGTGASSTATSSSDQFLVISTDSWLVNATVDSTGVGQIAVGNQAQIVPGSGTTTVYGTISSVGMIASSSSGVASYPVMIKVTGSPTGMHAGDSATVSLIYKQLSNVLTVPTLAVHQVNGKSVVYQMSGEKQVAKTVTVGLSSGGSTQITAGLKAGDQVVLEVAGSTPGGGTRSGANRTGNYGGGNFGGGGVPGGGVPGGGAFPVGGN